MIEEQPKAAFVTFYSFKGGVGRSMALINTAGILAGRGFRVLVIDLDLEAPGLSYLNPEAPDVPPVERASRPQQAGFVDLLHDAKTRGKEADLFTLPATELASRYTRNYYLPESFREFPDGSLHIMPAGRFDGEYAQRFDALNVHELYQVGLGEPLVRAFKKIIAEAGLYDYVLVDSRTGFSDEAGICTRDLADHLMILSGLNHQNVEGTCAFLRALREQTSEKEVKFDIILSPVPNGEDKLVDEREAEAEADFEAAWGSKIKLSLQIPYHPQLALTEEPHIFRRRRGYLFEAYRAIEVRLLVSLGHVARSVRRRIEEAIQHKDYRSALRDARRMVRLDGGHSALSRLSFLGENTQHWFLESWDDASQNQQETNAPRSVKRIALNEIASDEDGRKLVEFAVDHLPPDINHPETQRLLERTYSKFPELADRLYQRFIKTEPHNAGVLASYARFLQSRGNKTGADAFYLQAVGLAPENAPILRLYAIFLQQEGNDDVAESYYCRAIQNAPKHADSLSYYARFLAKQRGDKEGADAYYRRAIAAEPNQGNHLSDYGQFLVGCGRVVEGEQMLRRAFANSAEMGAVNEAEICFSLWLVATMQGRADKLSWEQVFKFFTERKFKRYLWDFSEMLVQAQKVLVPAEFEYAEALARAFLDETKVAELDHFERWRMLEPLEPTQVRQKLSIETSEGLLNSEAVDPQLTLVLPAEQTGS